MSALRKQMQADMVLRGLSQRTQQTYIEWVAKFAKFYARSPDQISDLEQDEPLPELLTVGPDTVYRLRYDENDLIKGATKFTDVDTTTRCVKFLEQLYAVGEELSDFFQRQVAALKPPIIT